MATKKGRTKFSPAFLFFLDLVSEIRNSGSGILDGRKSDVYPGSATLVGTLMNCTVFSSSMYTGTLFHLFEPTFSYNFTIDFL